MHLIPISQSSRNLDQKWGDGDIAIIIMVSERQYPVFIAKTHESLTLARPGGILIAHEHPPLEWTPEIER